MRANSGTCTPLETAQTRAKQESKYTQTYNKATHTSYYVFAGLMVPRQADSRHDTDHGRQQLETLRQRQKSSITIAITMQKSDSYMENGKFVNKCKVRNYTPKVLTS